MFKKILILAASAFFISALASPIYSASALDSEAEKKFNEATTQVGGSTADTLPATIKNIINLLLYLAGIIAVIIMVISGIRFITSDGNPQAADKARNAIIYAAVGLIIAVLAYAIVNFVLDRL